MPRMDSPGQPGLQGPGEKKERRTPGTHISVMFSGSIVLGSNLGNAMMPGIGSLHQIREALHLQDVGQARAALQKPTTSQQKPQSRAMAGPCHLVQDDIASRLCQPRSDWVRVPALHRPASAARAGRSLPRSLLSLLGVGRGPAQPRGSGAERILAGSTVHSGRGISGLLTGGATAARSSAVAAAAWPGALGTSRRCSGDSLGRRLLASHALRSQTHLGAEDKQTWVRLSAGPQRRRIEAFSFGARVTPTPTPARRLWKDECPAPTPEINLPLDGTDASFQVWGGGREDRARGPWEWIPWHRPGEEPFKRGTKRLPLPRLGDGAPMMLQNPPPLLGAGGAGRWRGTSHLGSRLSRPKEGTVRAETTEGTVRAAHPAPAPTACRRRPGPGSSCRRALSAESASEGASETPAPTQFREPPPPPLPPPLLLLAKWREGWRRAGAETPEN